MPLYHLIYVGYLLLLTIYKLTIYVASIFEIEGVSGPTRVGH